MKILHTMLFAQSYDERQPVRLLDGKHPGALAYEVLAEWLINYENAERERF